MRHSKNIDTFGSGTIMDFEWVNVTECVTCPLKYKTGDKSMCNLGIGEIPQQGISHNCPAIRYDVRLVKKVKKTILTTVQKITLRGAISISCLLVLMDNGIVHCN